MAVWVDEAEIRLGDSLLEKISGAISDLDYLGVVISRHSARSDWVRREVALAMSSEVAGQEVKVLPLLLRGGELPEALRGKMYADFSSELRYAPALELVLSRLGVARSPSEPPDRLSELTSSNALLRTALLELEGEGLANSTADALVSAQIDDFDLSEFLSLAARKVAGKQLFGLAVSLPEYIDQRGVGHEALEYCLRPGKLEDRQTAYVGMHMQYVTQPAAVVWCHARLTSLIRSDACYHSFLARHVDTVIERCFPEMASYLLHPNRGPADYNVDSFEIVLSHADDSRPFEHRWIEWIDNGYFDRREMLGFQAARILYLILNEHWGDSRFQGIVAAVQARVHSLLRSSSNDRVKDGLYHVVAMVDARYRGSAYVLRNTIPRVYDLPFEQRELFDRLRTALQAVVAYNEDPHDPAREALVRDCYLKVADADADGLTGYWSTDSAYLVPPRRTAGVVSPEWADRKRCPGRISDPSSSLTLQVHSHPQ